MMHSKVREALKVSIHHWEENAKVDDISAADISYTSCALCVLFFDREDVEKSCVGCPVDEATGDKLCRNTPYYDALKACEIYDLAGFLDAAKREVAFLKSLLPETPE